MGSFQSNESFTLGINESAECEGLTIKVLSINTVKERIVPEGVEWFVQVLATHDGESVRLDLIRPKNYEPIPPVKWKGYAIQLLDFRQKLSKKHFGYDYFVELKVQRL